MHTQVSKLGCWSLTRTPNLQSSNPPCPPLTICPSPAERWPLLLDPNLTALQWVKEREGKRGGLVCSRMGAPDLLRVMERAIAEVSWVGWQGERAHSLLLLAWLQQLARHQVLVPPVCRATRC